MKAIFKVYTLVSILGFIGISINAHSEGEDLNARKAEMNANIDAKIKRLQEHKTCINSASTREAMKACHEQMENFHEQMRASNMEKRKSHIDEKIRKLEEKKAKLANPPVKN